MDSNRFKPGDIVIPKSDNGYYLTHPRHEYIGYVIESKDSYLSIISLHHELKTFNASYNAEDINHLVALPADILVRLGRKIRFEGFSYKPDGDWESPFLHPNDYLLSLDQLFSSQYSSELLPLPENFGRLARFRVNAEGFEKLSENALYYEIETILDNLEIDETLFPQIERSIRSLYLFSKDLHPTPVSIPL